MSILSYRNTAFNLEIEAEQALVLGDVSLNAFEISLSDFVIGGSIKEFDFKKVGGKYEYTFKDDAKMWKQTLWIPVDGTEASMDFTVTGEWKESVFALHRPVRQAVIEMVRKFKITKIKGDWT